MKKHVILLTLFLLVSVPALAADVEVKQDGSGVGGYTTITGGIAAAGADGVGGTVTVNDSATYAETLWGSTVTGWSVIVTPGLGQSPTLALGTTADVGWFSTFLYLYSDGQKITFDGFRVTSVSAAGQTNCLVRTASTNQEVTIRNCTFTGDSRSFLLWIGGGLGDSTGAKFTLENNRFYLSNFDAGQSGLVSFGANAPNSTLTMDQNTYVHNPAGTPPGYALIWSEVNNSSATATNTIFRDESVTPAQVFAEWASVSGASFVADYCNYTAGTIAEATWTVTNSQTGNPNLVDPANGDFTLPTSLPGSVACGAGNALNGAVNIGWDQNPSCTVSVYDWRRY